MNLDSIKRHHGAPVWLWLGKSMSRNGIRGGDRLLRIAKDAGWYQCLADYPLHGRIGMYVPLYREENFWDSKDLKEYENDLIDTVIRYVHAAQASTIFLDCGAEIGTFSMKVIAQCPQVKEAIAFEPNVEAHGVLEKNYARLPIRAQAMRMGVGDRKFRGRLKKPDYAQLEYSWYVEEDANGDFEVTSIDALNLSAFPLVVLKIDVEGAELEVLQGATETLKKAGDFIAVIETHPQVIRRTGVDPSEMFKHLLSIRDCHFVISEVPEIQLDPRANFLKQIPDETRTFNVIVSTKELR